MACFGCVYTNSKLAVPLTNVDVTVTVSGFVASISSKLTYNSQIGDEAEFLFPLDDQSAVYHFQAQIGDRTIVGECQEKQQARETYNEALSHGRMAALLEEEDCSGDIFRCLLGNIPINTDVIVEFCYVIELSLEADGGVKFCLPTVLNPRYNPSVEDGGTTSQLHIPCNPQSYRLSIALEVNDSKELLSVSTGKDKWNINYSNEEKTAATLSLASEFKFDHDLECVLYYRDPYTPHSVVARGDSSKEGLLKENIMMLSYFPELKDDDFSSKHEFIFIVDRSGSMGGTNIKQARETLLLMLKSLPQGCYFNIISFGSRYEALFPEGSREYTQKNLQQAYQLQKKMEADFGGTEILAPLRYVYNIPPLSSHSRQIMLLTDGGVSNTQAVISLVKENIRNARMFSFGIGSGASTALVKGVARAGRGKAEFISDNERMQTKVMKCLQSALQATVTDLSLKAADDTATHTVIPSQVPALFSGDKLVLYTMVPDVDVMSMKLTGKVGERLVEFNITGSSGVLSEDFRFHRLASKAQIKELEASTDVETQKAKIVLLSRAANIVSKYTSFVAVDKNKDDGEAGQNANMITKTSQRRIIEPSTGMSGFRSLSLAQCPMPPESLSTQCSTIGCNSQYRPMSRSNLLGQSARTFKAQSQSRGSSILSSIAAIPGAISRALFTTPNNSSTIDESLACENECENKNDPTSIIVLQQFNGSWLMEQDLANLLKKPLEELTKAAPVKELNLWATVLALAWLETHWSSLKDEWILAESKAVNWITARLNEGLSKEDLMKQAKTLV